MYTVENYQDDKQFEVYLIVNQEINKLSGGIKDRLSVVLDYCYLQKKDLQKVFCLAKKAYQAQN
ncbi:MAG: hypothetical protein NTX91_05065 [candidate division SR1 bacterium]|nr:hypothetical protein [candidate division SR1 bacterium]